MLVARIQGRHGVDLDTQIALEEFLEGRQYEQLFSWPEQGLEVYLVGASNASRNLQLGARDSCAKLTGRAFLVPRSSQGFRK